MNKNYVLIVPDGAGDVARIGGKSPLELARIPNMDMITRLGVAGLMQTLYDDLPKGSIVAQLGMLGYDPYVYYPHGRASCEALAVNVDLEAGDIAFRANLAYMKGDVLDSYNAGYIKSEIATFLISYVQDKLAEEFPDFELYHNSDFRNTLILRRANVDPRSLICPEPHENMGNEFKISHLVQSRDKISEKVAKRINLYLVAVRKLLSKEPANAIFPWSASTALELPAFNKINHFSGRGALIGHMDFLHGIARAAGLDSYNLGNGNWDTCYAAKGQKLIELLTDGYDFIYCHINAPDEASHMGDLERKVYSIEQIDQHILAPTIEYFQTYPEKLGGVIVATDHYTNHFPRKDDVYRSETHSMHPVPFAIWNVHKGDEAISYSEEGVTKGKYGGSPISHLDLLKLLNWR